MTDTHTAAGADGGTDARTEILRRIRSAIGPDPQAVDVPRAYRTSADHDAARLREVLTDRLVDYRAQVVRSGATREEIAEAVTAVVREQGLRSVVAPARVAEEWLGGLTGGGGDEDAGTRVVVDDPSLTAQDLDAVDGVVTGSALAIVETGVVVLDGGEWCGRRAISLVPDVHVCVVRTDDVVAVPPEAVARLDPVRPQTWIAGPSATSDIELDRVEGVHGPRTLVVVLADGGHEAGAAAS